MSKKKIGVKKGISASLCLSMLLPMAMTAVPLTASAVDFNSFGIVGGMNNWSNDIMMNDDDGDGIYEANITNLSAGTYEFKVRADCEWIYSWGEYEAEYHRTCNSQTNLSATVKSGETITVKLDTRGSDYKVWPVYVSTDSSQTIPSVSFENFGVVGDFTGWGSESDITMTDDDGDGIYEAEISGLSAGKHEFRVRSGSDWENVWGAYEDNNNRTYNSLINVEVNIASGDVLSVKLDTKGDDYNLWPVTASVKSGSSVDPEIEPIEGIATQLKLLDEDGKDLGDDPIIYLDMTDAANGITIRRIKAVASDNNGTPVNDEIRCFCDSGADGILDISENTVYTGKAEMTLSLFSNASKKPGTTHLHFTTSSGEVYRTVTVVVYQPATDMKLFWGAGKTQLNVNDENVSNSTDIMVIANHQYQFTAEKVPSNSTDKVEWHVYEGDSTSEATNKAEITDNGLFTPKINGTVTIVAKYKATETSEREVAFGEKKINGQKETNVQNVPKYINVTIVKENPAQALVISDAPEDNAMQIGETYQLGYQALPSYTGAGYESGATDVFKWKSSNVKVATVDDKGLITAVGKGETTISVQGENENVRAEIVIKVITKATSISFDKQTMSTRVDVETPITAIMSPDTADEEIIWSSSDDSIATVGSITVGEFTSEQTAVVKGIKNGTVKITARAKSSGVEKSITCNVLAKIDATDIVLTSQSGTNVSTIYYGTTVKVFDQKQIRIDGILQASDGSTPDDTLKWEVLDNGANNGDYVTIDQVSSTSITLTGFAKGKVRVKASSTANPSLYKIFYVEILKRATIGKVINLAREDGKINNNLNVGSTLSLGVDLKIDSNQPYAHDDKVVKWESNKPSFVTVDNSGFVNVVGNGSASIKYTTESGLTGSVTLTGFTTSSIVIRNVNLGTDILPSMDVVLSKEMTVTKQLSATVKNEKDSSVSNAAVIWTSSDERIATVSQDGLLTAKNTGDTIITAKSGNKSDQCIVHVTYSLANATINIDPVYFTPGLKEYTPRVEVIVPGGTDIWGEPLDDIILTEGNDYTISFANNTTVGQSASVNITGIGQYSGTAKKSFKINQKPVTDPDVVVKTIDPIELTMENKSGVKPVPVITYMGYQLESGVDFTLTYSANTKPGNATITITCKGNFSGKIVSKFELYCNHTETSETVKTKPTCKSTGLSTEKCLICGFTQEVVTPAGGHTLTSPERVQPTCTEDGYEKGKCSVCGEMINNVLPATGHNIVHHDAKAPTEDEIGWDAYDECTKCDYTTYKEIPRIFVNRSTISTTSATTATDVVLTASATGGVAPYTYTYRCKKSGTSTWTYLGSTNVTTANYIYSPTEAGTYDIQILVKDSQKSVVTKGFTLKVTAASLTNKSTISATSTKTGTAVTLTAKAAGGTAPYTYTYRCRQSGTAAWKYLGSTNVTTTTYKYTPTDVGTFELQVLVKDAKKAVVSKGFTLDVAPGALANNSTISTTSAKTGSAVTLTAKAVGGTAPYTYTYRCKKSGTSTWTYLGETNVTTTTYSYMPTDVGTFELQVLVKDATKKVAIKGFQVTVEAGALVNGSTISTTNAKTGSAVTLTAKAAGGTAPYTYTYRCKKSGTTKWTYLGATNVTTTTYSYTPTEVGTFELQVLVKDAAKTVAIKGFQVDVAAGALSNISTISATSTKTGSSVTLMADAVGGTAPYTYTYRCKKSGTSTWTYIGATNVTTTTCNYTPTDIGTFELQVLVKDANKTVAIKGFKVTVEAGALANCSTISSTTVEAGSAVTLTAKAVGGTEPYTYTIRCKKSGTSTWKYLAANVQTTTYNYSPAAAGTYDIQVLVKDAEGTVVTKGFKVNVTE